MCLHKMQTERSRAMAMIFSKKHQKNLLVGMAMNRMNRKKLSISIGISVPTTRKLLTENAPIAISNKTYVLVQKWLTNISTKE